MMNRRDFIKTSAAAAVAAPSLAVVPALGKAPKKLFASTPKTVDELYTAINMVFESKGEFDKAYITECMKGWERRIVFKTYTPLGNKREGFELEVDGYYNNPIDPVLAIWKNVLDFKADIRNNWTEEQILDWDDRGDVKGELVWWRHRPELVETKNGLYTVYMRAEFA